MSEPDVSMARPQEFKHVLTRMKATLNGTEELLAEFAEQLGRWRAVTTRSSGMAGLTCKLQCAVKRRVLSVGEIPTRQLSLQPVAIGAAVEVTKQSKPLM
jgi:hypothetical protein